METPILGFTYKHDLGQKKGIGRQNVGSQSGVSPALGMWEAASAPLKLGGEWRAAEFQPHPPWLLEPVG